MYPIQFLKVLIIYFFLLHLILRYLVHFRFKIQILNFLFNGLLIEILYVIVEKIHQIYHFLRYLGHSFILCIFFV